MNKWLMLVALVCCVSSASFAEEDSVPSSKNKINKSDLKVKKQSQDDIDNEITNARMRAATGSKSKYSVKTSLSYQGGSVESPFSKERPKIMGDFGERANTNMQGAISFKYRASKHDNISVGTSLALVTPFHESVNTVNDRGNFDDPYINYERVYKVGRFQMTSSLQAQMYTIDETRALDYWYNVNPGHNMLITFDNGLTTGVLFDLTLKYFEGDSKKINKYKDANKDIRDNQDDYQAAIYPYLEYTFTDRYSFRTVFGIARYQHIRSENDRFALEKAKNYQSVGVGITVNRDVYLYPNVQVIPGNLRAEATNVGVSAFLNLF